MKKSVGRPAKEASEVDNDNTAASQDGGLNEGSMRYAVSGGKCIFCGADVEDNQIMCESCRETFLEEGGEL